MKRKLSLVAIVIAMLGICFLVFKLLHIRISKNEIYIQQKEEQADFNVNNSVKRSKLGAINIKNNELVYLNAVIEKNENMIREYLKENEEDMRWIDISLYDFTRDGKKEIILSKTYLDGYLSVISYNYVYDQNGDELFEFISGTVADMEIYADNENKEFYLQSAINWGSHNNTILYSKIVKEENWEKKIIITEWDMRQAGEHNNTEENYFVFCIPLEKEQDFFENMYEEMMKFRDEKSLNMEQFNSFLSSYENLEKSKADAYGSIYCLENKLIIETEGKQFFMEE